MGRGAPSLMLRPARTGDAAGIARVHVDSWRSTYAGLLPADFLAGLTYARQQARWEQILAAQGPQNFVYVVEDAPGIVGFASGGREREGDALYSGELYAIYLLREHQRQGWGRDLVATVAGRLAEAGHQAMLVWVLADNAPARAFYERLGGAFVRSSWHDLGGIQREEVSYGWQDLERFDPR